MSYTKLFSMNFGPLTTLTLNGKLFDSAGVQVGGTITSGIVDHGDGSYSYLATLPDDHVGTLVFYDSTNTSRKIRFSINPSATEETIATAVWVYAPGRTLTSFGSLVADIWGYINRTLTDGSVDVNAIAAAVWAYVRRTLTSTAAETMEAVTGDNVNITKSATFTAQLTGLNISGLWSKIYFTVKASNQHGDDQSLVQILKSNPSFGGDGLIRLNRAAATAGQGALTIDQPGGSVTITLADEATLDLNHGDYFYDVKALHSDGSSAILAQGSCLVRLTSTHAV